MKDDHWVAKGVSSGQAGAMKVKHLAEAETQIPIAVRAIERHPHDVAENTVEEKNDERK